MLVADKIELFKTYDFHCQGMFMLNKSFFLVALVFGFIKRKPKVKCNVTAPEAE
jgi:hypothetical protein